MALFPTFIDLDKKKILLIGGGIVATRKLEKLQMFKPSNINLVAIDFHHEFLDICEEFHLKYDQRAFEWSDLKDVDMVIVAVDDIALQAKIFDHCQESRILCNSVDSVNYCNFIFPALVTRGDLCLGINTNGKAPYLSKRIRQMLDRVLPLELGRVVEDSGKFRDSQVDKKKMEPLIKSFIDNLLEKIDFKFR